MERCDRCGTDVAEDEACPGCGLAPTGERPCAKCGTRLAYHSETHVRPAYAVWALVLFGLGSSCTFCRLASANTPVIGVVLLLAAFGLVAKGMRPVKVLKCPRCGGKRYSRES